MWMMLYEEKHSFISNSTVMFYEKCLPEINVSFTTSVRPHYVNVLLLLFTTRACGFYDPPKLQRLVSILSIVKCL